MLFSARASLPTKVSSPLASYRFAMLHATEPTTFVDILLCSSTVSKSQLKATSCHSFLSGETYDL